MTNIPLFGSGASLISPPAGTVTSGYLPLQYLPAENLNFYLNATTQAVQEIVSLIQFAGLTPSSALQLLPTLSGILTSAFAGTYVNRLAITNPATLATLTILAAKTFTVNKSLTLDGTDGKTFTDKTSFTVQGTDGNVIDTDAIIRTCYQGLVLTYVNTTSFSVGIGAVGDSTFVSTMVLAATTTKTTSAWAVGSGNGGLDTGSIASSTWYYVYLIKRPDTQVVDVLFSTSASSPTMPANYTLKRLIGAIKTDGSSHWIQWIMYANGRQAWVTLTNDINDTTLTTARKSYTLTTVPNVPCDIAFNWTTTNAAGEIVVYCVGDTNLTDSAPGITGIGTICSIGSANPGCGIVSNFFVLAQTFYARSNAASTTLIVDIVSFNVRPFN